MKYNAESWTGRDSDQQQASSTQSLRAPGWGGRSVKSQKCQRPKLGVVLTALTHISWLEFSHMTAYEEKTGCSLHVRRKGKMDSSGEIDDSAHLGFLITLAEDQLPLISPTGTFPNPSFCGSTVCIQLHLQPDISQFPNSGS